MELIFNTVTLKEKRALTLSLRIGQPHIAVCCYEVDGQVPARAYDLQQMIMAFSNPHRLKDGPLASRLQAVGTKCRNQTLAEVDCVYAKPRYMVL